MIYYLLYPLHTYESLSFLNVLRYVPFRFDGDCTFDVFTADE